jgi:pSer/pThr/pTyr-binding forkhead associated (FHA) protein
MPLPNELEFHLVGTEHKLRAPIASTITIGRSDPTQDAKPDVDLEPHRGYHQGVSRRHAVISAQDSGVVIINISSTNGTFVNGTPLATGEAFPLQDGDEIAMGMMRLQVAFVYVPASGGV